jgi:hypothetical protein
VGAHVVSDAQVIMLLSNSDQNPRKAKSVITQGLGIDLLDGKRHSSLCGSPEGKKVPLDLPLLVQLAQEIQKAEGMALEVRDLRQENNALRVEIQDYQESLVDAVQRCSEYRRQAKERQVIINRLERSLSKFDLVDGHSGITQSEFHGYPSSPTPLESMEYSDKIHGKEGSDEGFEGLTYDRNGIKSNFDVIYSGIDD